VKDLYSNHILALFQPDSKPIPTIRPSLNIDDK